MTKFKYYTRGDIVFQLISFFFLFQGYGTPNPATPGGFNAPYTPGTPGGIYGSEPTYSPYVDSPSPAGYANPATPGSVNPSPISPAFHPHTPGASLEVEAPHEWATQDIEVTITDSYQVSLVCVPSCSNTGSIRDDTYWTFRVN